MNIWSNIYRHHRWSNLTLIDFLSSLTEKQLSLTVPGTFGNLLATIRHLISGNANYVRFIAETPNVPRIAQDGPFGGWNELHKIADAADTALIDDVDGLTDDAFLVDVKEGQELLQRENRVPHDVRPALAGADPA